jgi:hypothetical protein
MYGSAFAHVGTLVEAVRVCMSELIAESGLDTQGMFVQQSR